MRTRIVLCLAQAGREFQEEMIIIIASEGEIGGEDDHGF